MFFSRLSYEYGTKCFYLKAEGVLGKDTYTCYSMPICVMYYNTNRQIINRGYQLMIVNSISPIWYKDEKGKKHHIPIKVKLVV